MHSATLETGPRRALRSPERGWVAGICVGLADNLRWPVALVRLAFVVLTLANGVGVILYLAFWAVLPARDPRRQSDIDLLRMLAFGGVVVGLAVLAYASGWGAFRNFVAPLLVLGLGLALLWQQWGEHLGDRVGAADNRMASVVRPLVGVALVAAGVAALVIGEVGLRQGAQAILVVLLVLGGAALLALPWVVRTLRDLTDERRARIREQERAEIAAHVHDSVLQTLTLIQRNAGDAGQVQRLARAEERRLRSWLYEPVSVGGETLASALQHQAARIESEYEATIDVVQVGDAPLSPATRALLGAGAEAMVNAARHSAVPAPISVYCEVADATAKLFVRDRGSGFDPGAVPADRHGIRESIVGRMERAGGSSEFTSGPTGTEVRLAIGLEAS